MEVVLGVRKVRLDGREKCGAVAQKVSEKSVSHSVEKTFNLSAKSLVRMGPAMRQCENLSDVRSQKSVLSNSSTSR